MLGLPVSTEIHKVLTKKKVFEHFGANMSTERRKRFDADIARMTLVHEISPVSLNLEAGETVQSLFVMHVLLRTADLTRKASRFCPGCSGSGSCSCWKRTTGSGWRSGRPAC